MDCIVFYCNIYRKKKMLKSEIYKFIFDCITLLRIYWSLNLVENLMFIELKRYLLLKFYSKESIVQI